MTARTGRSDQPMPANPRPAVDKGNEVKRRRPRHDTAGLLTWSSLILLVGLGLYYGWRTTSNWDRLTDRNLRELDRMGKTIEGRVGGFVGLLERRQIDTTDAKREGGLVESLHARADSLIPHLDGRQLGTCNTTQLRLDQGLDICVATDPDVVGRRGVWTLDPLRDALEAEFFDAVFVARDSGQVFIQVTAAGGLRVNESPIDVDELRADTSGAEDGTKFGARQSSTVGEVSIAGRDYRVFLQPLQIRLPSGPDEPPSLKQWTVGGLVAADRLRAESLALGTSHRVFLGLILILAILALPLLRVTLIGPWERVNVRDVYMLSLALVLMSGLLGVALADRMYYQRFSGVVDDDIERLASHLADNLREEIKAALVELERQNEAFEGSRKEELYALGPEREDRLRYKEEIFDSAVGIRTESTDTTRGEQPAHRYLGYQMVFWTDPAGMQVAKWTPRKINTPRVKVGGRPYFYLIRDRAGWATSGLNPLPGAGPEPEATAQGTSRTESTAISSEQFYLQSLRSWTTVEHLAAVSVPFCWSDPWATQPCRREDRGAAVIMASLGSLDRPVLPPGIEFAVIEPDGRTLFHSRPARNLDEYFFEETDGNAGLRSRVAARTPGRLDAVYMGRPSRLQVTPIAATPLSLVVVLEDGHPGAVRFQALSLSLAMFGAWVIALWVLFVVVELLTPGRLQWAWPDRKHPLKHKVLAKVLGAFAAVLAAQVAAAVWLPVHSSTLLVPVQALALGLVILSRGNERSPRLVVPRWRDPIAIGWTALGVATVLQLVLHWPPGGYLLLGVLQLAAATWAAHEVASMDSRRSDAVPRELTRRWYVVAVALTLAVVGFLPAYLFYQEVFADNLERFVRHHQAEIVRRMDERAHRIREVNRLGGLPEGYDPLFIEQPYGRAFEPFFTSDLPNTRGGSVTVKGCRWEQVASVRNRLRLIDAMSTWHFSDLAAEMGSLTTADIEGYDWVCAGNTLHLTAPGYLRPEDRYMVRSQIPAVLSSSSLRWLPALFIAMVLLWMFGRWLGRRVFLLDLHYADPTGDIGAGESLAGPLIVVCTRSMEREALKTELEKRGFQYASLLDLVKNTEDENAKALKSELKSSGGPVCLDHFDQQLANPSWTRPLLAALEKAIYVENRVVVLLTSREPGLLFPQSGEVEVEDDEVGLRWVRLLGQFVKLTVADLVTRESGDSAASSGGRLRDRPQTLKGWFLEIRDGIVQDMQSPARLNRGQAVLAYESRTLPALQDVVVHAERRLETLTPDALLDLVREMADRHYHALWSILDREEKLVVAQLADGAVVNPKCERAVRRLLARKILVLKPELSLMNESFARFVKEEISPSTIAAWERQEPASNWQRLRFPILLALAAVVTFVFVTQRPAFDAVIAVLSAAAIGSTAAVRLMSLARSADAAG